MAVTLLPIVTVFKMVLLSKQPLGIVEIPLPIITFSYPIVEKAKSPIAVTLSTIVKVPDKDSQPEKAFSPI